MLLVFIIGLTFGSFANVLIKRLPHNINLLTSSHCFHCKSPLRWRELIPIFSWCIQKGRCKHCHHKISLLYPFLEGVIAFSFITSFYFSSNFLMACLLCLLNYLFILAIVIDVREKIILDWINIAIAITLLFLQINGYKEIYGVFLPFFITLFIGVGLKIIFTKIKNIPALGDGDIKLTSALSLGLELDQLPFWFVFSGGLGILTGIVWQKFKQEKTFPFGPALIIGFMMIYFKQFLNLRGCFPISLLP